MGTSNNKGWGAMMAAAYSRRADVVNRGFGGYTTSIALEVLPEVRAQRGREEKRGREENRGGKRCCACCAATALPLLPAAAAHARCAPA